MINFSARSVLKFSLILTAIIFLFFDAAKAQRRTRSDEQYSFGSETLIKRPVKIQKSVVRQILKLENNAELIKQCLDGKKITEASVSQFFAASIINLNGDKLPDLVVQAGEYCLQGAHNTPFWIFTGTGKRLKPDFKLSFNSQTDFLEILATKSNGYRDISAVGHTAIELFTTIYKFDGQKYQPRICTIENMETKKLSHVKCNRN